jgi:lambda family phage portal protein
MGMLARIAQAIVPKQIRAQFEAGLFQRRLRSMPTSTNHVNALIRSYGKTVLARSRYLAANNAYASQAKEEFVSALVGCGIKPSSQMEAGDARDAVMQAWADWTDEADADGLTDFYGLQALVAAEMFEAGECFIRIRPRLPEDGLTVPMQLQLIPAEMLPLDLNYTTPIGRVECGIEFGPIGNRLAYHFLTRHPGQDVWVTPTDPSYYSVVPADQILHLFKPIRAGQIRGIPHTLSGIVTAAILDAYDDAELERKRTAALFTAFVQTPNPADDSADPLNAGTGLVNPPTSGLAPTGDTPMQPGATIYTAPGEEVKFAEPADVGGNYEAFQIRNLLRMCAGYGVPYHLVTGDLRQVNYSSIRAGLVAFRRRVEQMQHGVMAFQFCRPIWQRWFEDAVIAGAIPVSPRDYASDPKSFTRVLWRTPKWEWVDPQKDVAATIDAINAGLTSRDKAIEEMGEEPSDIDQSIADGQERADKLGIKIAITTRGTTAVPVAQPEDAPAPADSGTPAKPNAQAAVHVNIPTPWPNGEVTEVLAHDELGRVKTFIKRPVAAGE